MSPNELEGDLKEWGEAEEKNAKGLNALSYPSGAQQEFISGNGSPSVPDYYPNHQIRALSNAINRLISKYKNILILKYVHKISDREVGRAGECDRGTVPKRINEAKHLLVQSRYWKT